jgi:hypothetical protein
MEPYDDRRATLDPGLTALALRGRREAHGRYPFLERALRARKWWVLGAGILGGLAVWCRRGRRGPDVPPRPGSP